MNTFIKWFRKATTSRRRPGRGNSGLHHEGPAKARELVTRSDLLINMSHELRTPFQGLMGMLYLLNTTKLSAEQKDHVATALDSAQALLNTLNDLLDISMWKAGALELSSAPVDLRALTCSTHELMRQKCAEKALDLRMEYGEQLPRWVMGDALRIQQAISTLIRYAIKSTDSGGLLVRVDVDDNAKGRVMVAVEDTGNGMGESLLARLSTAGDAPQASPMRQSGDAGLGLSVTHCLVKLMKGDFNVSSTAGIGSRYVISLPLVEVAPMDHNQQARSDAVVEPRRLRLLVAEDHPINLKYMNLLLVKMGHEAVFCSGGHEALDLVQRQHFDAVLLDYHMPELDGIETAKAIRQVTGVSPTLKLLLVTADVAGDVRSRALQAGIDLFVSKPLTMPDLAQAFSTCGLLSSRAPDMTAPPGPGHLDGTGNPDPATFDQTAYQQLVPYTTREVRAEMAATILGPTSGTLEALVNALEQGEHAAIEAAAHALKGVALLLGLTGIASAASKIEGIAYQHIAVDTAAWTRMLRSLGERSAFELAMQEALMDEGPPP